MPAFVLSQVDNREALVEQSREREMSRARRTNPREQRFNEWLGELRDFLRAKRGRPSTLAKYLCTRRQNTHRWFVEGHTQIPAWAAVHANIWYQRVRLVCDEVCPPREGHDGK